MNIDTDNRIKLWIISDDATNAKIYTTSTPLHKLNRYLFSLETEHIIDSDLHESVFNYFKNKALDNMHIGELYYYDRFSIACVELED